MIEGVMAATARMKFMIINLYKLRAAMWCWQRAETTRDAERGRAGAAERAGARARAGSARPTR